MTEQWNAAEGRGGGANLLGPIIGIIGETVQGVGTLVHAVPVAGPVVQAVTQATGGTIVGAGQVVGGVTQGVGTTLASVATALDVIPGVGTTLAAAVDDVSTVVSGTSAALDPEAGSSTSEFKVLVGAIVSILAMFGVTIGTGVVNVLDIVGPICLTVLAAVYGWLRTSRKTAAANAAAAVATSTQKAA